MIITCPGCAIRYEVPETAISRSGRRVRCKTCSFVWHAVPDEGAPGIADDEPGEPGLEPRGDTWPSANPQFDIAEHRVAAERLERKLATLGGGADGDDLSGAAAHAPSPPLPGALKPRHLPATFVACTALLVLLAGAAYEYRESVVRAAPRLASLYELAAIRVNIRGMEFANVAVGREYDNGLPVLAVRGEIVNVAQRSLDVPRLRIGLRDNSRQEIYHWTAAVASDRLAPDERASFVTRLAAPPAAARDVELRFLDMADRRAGP